MKKKHIFIFASLLPLSFFMGSCKSEKADLLFVENLSPKYVDNKYIEIEQLYTIDVTQISMFSKESGTDFGRFIDFDSDDNMYILDPYESTVSVFNRSGQYIRSFGKSGQGPNEFMNPNALIIKGDKLYIFEGWSGYKLVDLSGEYISRKVIQIENRLKLAAVGDSFYLLRGKTDRTFTTLEFILTVEDDTFSANNELFRYDYPPGLRGPYYDFSWPNWMLVSENGEFFFPDDNFKKYSITKYNKKGKPILKFGRPYALANYSKEAKERFYTIYKKQIERGDSVFPEYPPIVGNMFLDERKDVWVIVGEAFEDNGNPEFQNTIDIFDDKGTWVYTIKSNMLSRSCLYRRGRVYRVLPINLDTFEQYIEVYKVKYRNSP